MRKILLSKDRKQELELIKAREDRIDLKDVKKQGAIPWKKVKSELGLY